MEEDQCIGGSPRSKAQNEARLFRQVKPLLVRFTQILIDGDPSLLQIPEQKSENSDFTYDQKQNGPTYP